VELNLLVLEVSPETCPPHKNSPRRGVGVLTSMWWNSKPGEFLKPNRKLNA